MLFNQSESNTDTIEKVDSMLIDVENYLNLYIKENTFGIDSEETNKIICDLITDILIVLNESDLSDELILNYKNQLDILVEKNN